MEMTMQQAAQPGRHSTLRSSSYSMFRIFFLKNFQLNHSETMVDLAEPAPRPEGRGAEVGVLRKIAP